jgi:ribosomal protein L32
MAVPKKRVSRTRKNLRHTNWKKEVIPQALKALSLAKSSRTTRGNFRFAGAAQSSQPDSTLKNSQDSEPTEGFTP